MSVDPTQMIEEWALTIFVCPRGHRTLVSVGDRCWACYPGGRLPLGGFAPPTLEPVEYAPVEALTAALSAAAPSPPDTDERAEPQNPYRASVRTDHYLNRGDPADGVEGIAHRAWAEGFAAARLDALAFYSSSPSLHGREPQDGSIGPAPPCPHRQDEALKSSPTTLEADDEC